MLNGPMLVARDQAHGRLAALIELNKPLPVSLEGETIYYMGPAPAKPGEVIGSCGPTTASRMDPYTPLLMDYGLLCTIGKGPRSLEVAEAVERNSGLYLYAYGGCGALYAKCVTSVEILAFKDLGPEALLRITVSNFPVIAAIDSSGKNIYPVS